MRHRNAISSKKEISRLNLEAASHSLFPRGLAIRLNRFKRTPNAKGSLQTQQPIKPKQRVDAV